MQVKDVARRALVRTYLDVIGPAAAELSTELTAEDVILYAHGDYAVRAAWETLPTARRRSTRALFEDPVDVDMTAIPMAAASVRCSSLGSCSRNRVLRQVMGMLASVQRGMRDGDRLRACAAQIKKETRLHKVWLEDAPLRGRPHMRLVKHEARTDAPYPIDMVACSLVVTLAVLPDKGARTADATRLPIKVLTVYVPRGEDTVFDPATGRVAQIPLVYHSASGIPFPHLCFAQHATVRQLLTHRLPHHKHLHDRLIAIGLVSVLASEEHVPPKEDMAAHVAEHLLRLLDYCRWWRAGEDLAFVRKLMHDVVAAHNWW